MKNKLQELLKWLSEANEYQVDGLYEVIINEQLHYIDDVVGKDVYKEFIEDIEEEAKHNIKCYKCDADINDEIYCKDCLEGMHSND